jgi:hypothetical protein
MPTFPTGARTRVPNWLPTFIVHCTDYIWVKCHDSKHLRLVSELSNFRSVCRTIANGTESSQRNNSSRYIPSRLQTEKGLKLYSPVFLSIKHREDKHSYNTLSFVTNTWQASWTLESTVGARLQYSSVWECAVGIVWTIVHRGLSH